MFHRILVPVDATPHARRAVALAGDLAHRYQAAVTALAIGFEPAPAPPVDLIGVGPLEDAVRLRDEAQLARAIEAATALLREAGVEPETASLWLPPFGDLADAIVRYAREGHYDLIVIGESDRPRAFGRSPSVADRVLRHAHCPVLVAPPAPTGAEAHREHLDLRIGSPVFTRDGRAGRLEWLVISPGSRQVTHLVVTKGFLLHEDVVVPINRVARVTETGVELDLTADELNAMPRYREVEYVAPDPTWFGAQPYRAAEVRIPLDPSAGALADRQPALVGQVWRRDRTGVPVEALVLRRGARVLSNDGPVGVVDHVLLDAERRQVTHFVIRRSGLLGRDVIVPSEWVSDIADGAVVLDVGRAQIEQLPEYRPDWSDEELAAATQQALQADPRTQGLAAEVRAERGVVQLAGESDAATRRAASAVARTVPGVLAVRNELVTAPGEPLRSAVGLGYGWIEPFLRRTTGLHFDEELAGKVVALAERKLGDLFEIAEQTALANGRAVILPHDLPLTKGLRATIQEYERHAGELDAEAIECFLRDVGVAGPLDEVLRAALPRLLAALLILTGRVIALLEPESLSAEERLARITRAEQGRPTEWELERAARILELVL